MTLKKKYKYPKMPNLFVNDQKVLFLIYNTSREKKSLLYLHLKKYFEDERLDNTT